MRKRVMLIMSVVLVCAVVFLGINLMQSDDKVLVEYLRGMDDSFEITRKKDIDFIKNFFDKLEEKSEVDMIYGSGLTVTIKSGETSRVYTIYPEVVFFGEMDSKGEEKQCGALELGYDNYALLEEYLERINTEAISIDEKLEVIFDDEEISLKDITVDQMKSVHIYSVSVEKGGEYSDQKLSQIELKSTEEPEVYFGKIEYCDERVLWKGDNLGVIHMKDGSDIRVRISSYGDFFSIIGERGYYKYKSEK